MYVCRVPGYPNEVSGREYLLCSTMRRQGQDTRFAEESSAAHFVKIRYVRHWNGLGDIGFGFACRRLGVGVGVEMKRCEE